MLKMPEKRKPGDCKYGIEVGHGCECVGWNACHDQWLAYHKQEVIKEHKLNCSICKAKGKLPYAYCKRIAALQAELKEGK